MKLSGQPLTNPSANFWVVLYNCPRILLYVNERLTFLRPRPQYEEELSKKLFALILVGLLVELTVYDPHEQLFEERLDLLASAVRCDPAKQYTDLIEEQLRPFVLALAYQLHELGHLLGHR